MSPIEQQHQEPPVYTYDVRHSDVRLGRGRECAGCIGTIAFKALLESRIDSYTNTKSTYGDKKRLCTEVVDTVHEAGGRFVLKSTIKRQGDSSKTKFWEVLDRTSAETKIRECFRDCVKRVNPSLLLVKAGISRKFTTQQTYSEILIQVEKCPQVHSFLQSQRSTTTKPPSSSFNSSLAKAVNSLHKSILPSQGLGEKEKLPSFSSPELPKAEWCPTTEADHTTTTMDFSPTLIDAPPPPAQPSPLIKKTTTRPPEPSSNFLDGMMFVWANLESLDDFLGRRNKEIPAPSQIETHENTPVPRTDGSGITTASCCKNTSSNRGSPVVVSATTPTTTPTATTVLPPPREKDDHSQNYFSELEEMHLLSSIPSGLELQEDSMSCFSSLCTTEDLSEEEEGWTNDDDVVLDQEVAQV